MNLPEVAFNTRMAACDLPSENEGQSHQVQWQAFIYARVATTQDDFERDISLNDQVARCRAHCEEMGYSVREVYVETCSGNLPHEKRSGFMNLLREISKVHDSVLVVTQRNRLARDVIVMLRMISAVRQCGGNIGFVMEANRQVRATQRKWSIVT